MIFFNEHIGSAAVGGFAAILTHDFTFSVAVGVTVWLVTQIIKLVYHKIKSILHKV